MQTNVVASLRDPLVLAVLYRRKNGVRRGQANDAVYFVDHSLSIPNEHVIGGKRPIIGEKNEKLKAAESSRISISLQSSILTG